jgi:hypothetical protein
MLITCMHICGHLWVLKCVNCSPIDNPHLLINVHWKKRKRYKAWSNTITLITSYNLWNNWNNLANFFLANFSILVWVLNSGRCIGAWPSTCVWTYQVVVHKGMFGDVAFYLRNVYCIQHCVSINHNNILWFILNYFLGILKVLFLFLFLFCDGHLLLDHHKNK